MKAQDFEFKTRDDLTLRGSLSFSSKDVTIIAVHGIGEHLGRHAYLRELFSEQFNIVQFDLRGHGRSDGVRGFVGDFSFFLNDLEDLISYLQKEHNLKRYFLFAHSMGSLISWSFLRRNTYSLAPEKVFLCAPPVDILGRYGKYLPQKLVQGFLKFPLRFWVPRPFSIKTLSHDPRVFEELKRDSLCLNFFSKNLLLGLANTAKLNFSDSFNPPCPVGVAIGSEDKIVYAPDVIEYFSHCGKRVSLKEITGSFHEIHNELDIYRQPYFSFLREFFKME